MIEISGGPELEGMIDVRPGDMGDTLVPGHE
jgi:hypothetical protein